MTLRNKILFLAVLLAASSLWAANRATYLGVRTMGMGGANLANIDDCGAMLINPACLDLYLDHMQLTGNFAAYGSSGLLDLMSFVSAHSRKLTNTDGLKNLNQNFFDDLYAIDGKWSAIGLIPHVGFMARTLGFTYGASYYWDMPSRVMIESGVLVPKVFLGTQTDQVFTGAVARRFNKICAVGVSLKLIDRYVLDDIALGYTETMEFMERFDNDKMNALDPLLSHQFGMGIDAGALFYFGEFRAALSLLDAFSYVGNEVLSPRPNVGFAYKILPFMDLKYVEDATVTVDIHNLFRYANFFTKINMGAELRLPNFDVRTGLHQGYPTFGMTLHYFIFRLDYLYYGEELGPYVNGQPLTFHLVQMGFDVQF